MKEGGETNFNDRKEIRIEEATKCVLYIAEKVLAPVFALNVCTLVDVVVRFVVLVAGGTSMFITRSPFVKSSANGKLFPSIFVEKSPGPSERFVRYVIRVPVYRVEGVVGPVEACAVIDLDGFRVFVPVEGRFDVSGDGSAVDAEHGAGGWVKWDCGL